MPLISRSNLTGRSQHVTAWTLGFDQLYPKISPDIDADYLRSNAQGDHTRLLFITTCKKKFVTLYYMP